MKRAALRLSGDAALVVLVSSYSFGTGISGEIRALISFSSGDSATPDQPNCWLQVT